MTSPGGPAWRQTTFYPFLHASLYGRGVSLDLRFDSPTYESRAYGDVPYIAAAAVLNEAAEELTIFAVNRSAGEALELEARLGGFEGWHAFERIEYLSRDPKAGNSFESPDALVPRRMEGGFDVDGELLSVRFAPSRGTSFACNAAGSGDEKLGVCRHPATPRRA